MKILVLGGTQFLSRAVVESLQKRGHQPTLLHRGKTDPSLFLELEHLHCDRNFPLEGMANRCFDYVLDISGQTPLQVSRSLEIPCRGYLFISTIAVYDWSVSDLPINEESPTVPWIEEPHQHDLGGMAYPLLKFSCEQMIRNHKPHQHCILRSGLLAGPGDTSDRFSYWVTRSRQGGQILVPTACGTANPGGDEVQVLDARDLADWVAAWVENPFYGTYNAVGATTRLADVIELCLALSPKISEICWVDGYWLSEQGIDHWTQLPLYLPPEIPLHQIDCARALERGLVTRPLRDTILDVAAWRESSCHPLAAGLEPQRERDLLHLWNQQFAEQ